MRSRASLCCFASSSISTPGACYIINLLQRMYHWLREIGKDRWHRKTGYSSMHHQLSDSQSKIAVNSHEVYSGQQFHNHFQGPLPTYILTTHLIRLSSVKFRGSTYDQRSLRWLDVWDTICNISSSLTPESKCPISPYDSLVPIICRVGNIPNNSDPCVR